MTKTLEKELKKKMGYTEKTVRCNICAFHEEIDGVLDRTWHSVCNYNPIQPLGVSQNGRCNYFRNVKTKVGK